MFNRVALCILCFSLRLGVVCLFGCCFCAWLFACGCLVYCVCVLLGCLCCVLILSAFVVTCEFGWFGYDVAAWLVWISVCLFGVYVLCGLVVLCLLLFVAFGFDGLRFKFVCFGNFTCFGLVLFGLLFACSDLLCLVWFVIWFVWLVCLFCDICFVV